MKTQTMLSCFLCLCVLSLGGCETSLKKEVADLQGQITALKARTDNAEQLIVDITSAVHKQQESLERQGNINTSLMNITEMLSKKGQ